MRKFYIFSSHKLVSINYLTLFRFYIIFSFFQLNFSIAIGQTGCLNADFSLGDFTGWNAYTGSFGSCCNTLGVVADRHTIISSPGTDPNTGGALSVLPPGETTCARLGNSSTGAEAEKLEYSITVTPNNALFIYKYAVVLQDPSHSSSQQPKFTINILNSSGNVIDPVCGMYQVIASGSIPGFQNYGSIRWKDWTTVGLNLTPYMGQSIKIEFATYDCSQGGHFGYAYLKCSCSKMTLGIGYCPGSSAVTISAPSGFSYLWSPGGQTTQNINISNPVDGTTYSCVLTSVNGCQVTLQSVLTQTIINANFSATPVNCSYTVNFTDLTTINQNEVAGWLWNFGDGNTSTLQNPSHTYSTYGNYNVSLVSTSSVGACQSTNTTGANQTINLPMLPVAEAGNSHAVCEGKNDTLTATGGISYQWNNGVINGTPFVPTGTKTYTVTVTNANNCTATDNVLVTVNSSPVPEAGINQTVCTGISVTLTATGGTSFQWNNGVNNETPFVPTTTKTYTVTVTNENGCSASDNVQVTVNSLPIPEAGSDQTYCLGTIDTLTATGGTSYQWNNGITNGVPFTPASTKTYIVTVTDANNCTATDNVTLTVNPLPIPEAGNNRAYCFGKIDTLIATGGISYQWNNGITNGIPFTPTSTKTYIVTVSDANACSATDNVTLTVYSLPIPDAGNNQIFCLGTVDTLTATGGTSYQWNNGVTNGVPFTPTSTKTYIVTVSDANNCTATDNVTLTVISLPIPEAGNDQTFCLGTIITLSANGGTSYQWNNGVTDGVPFTPTSTKTYTVTVTDGNYCTATDNITLNVDPLPIAEAGTNQTVCAGTSVTLTATGGTSYEWNNGVFNGIPFVPTTTKTYTVTVTDGNGCTATDNVLVIVNSLPIPEAGNDQIVCAGTSVTITATGGISYQWDNGVTNGVSFVPTITKTYTVTVKNINNCTATDYLQVTVNPLPIPEAGNNQTVCAGVSVTLNATAGTSYQWNNGVTNGVPFVPTSTKTYTVTVKNIHNCTATDNVQVTVNSLPIPEAGDNQTVCAGERVTLNGAGGTSYLWNNSVANGVTFVPTTTSTYIVTVKDGNNCTATDNVLVTVNPLPIPEAGDNQTVCAEVSVTLTATGGTSFQWNNGVTNEVPFVPSATNVYTVTVTNTHGCTATDNVQVNVNNLPIADAGLPKTICIEQSTTLTATGVGTYQWVGGPPTATYIVSPITTTTYFVTVTNSNGCTASDSVLISVTLLPIPDAGLPQTICAGQSTDLTATGGGTYQWDGVPATETYTVSPLSTTTYTVIVTKNGCTASDNVQINVTPLPLADAGLPQTLCFGQSDTLIATGGGTYQWDAGPATATYNITPSATTTYTVTVTKNGCSASDNVQIVVNTLPLAEAGSNQIICYGQSSNLTAYGGTAYSWSNNSNSQSINVSPSATTTYIVTVTNINNCTATDFIQVTVNPLPLAEAGSNLTICYADSTRLNASGGTDYVWFPTTKLSNSNIFNPFAFPLTSTTYSVTVTDNNGCSAADNVAITVYPQIPASAGSDRSICKFQESADLNAQGGVAYEWRPSTGLSNPIINNPIASPNSTTTYTVTVRDVGGCTATDDIILTVNTVPSYTFISDSVNCYSGTDGLIILSPSGGTRPYTYTWSPQVSIDSAAVNISAGLYQITITDNNGCDTSANIPINTPPQLTLSTSGDITICTGDSTIISAIASGGTGTHTFTWDNGLGTGSSFKVNPPNTKTYTVFVTDEKGCAVTPISLTVTVLPPITVDISANPDVICFGENSILTALATGGNQNYTFIWEQGISNQSITVTPSTNTTYRITVTDNCGSPKGFDSVQVIVNPLPVIDFSSDTRNGCQPLEVHFTDNSTPAINAWLWNFGDYQSGNNNNSTIQNPTHLYSSSGVYTVTLSATTANNCTIDSAFQNMIDVYPKPLANFNINPSTGTTLLSPIVFFDLSTNATQWYWDFGDTASLDNTSNIPNQQHTYNKAGTYLATLIVSSINGCLDTISKEVIITQDFAIFFPTAFSPNNDGYNDLFKPEGDGIDLNNYELLIFNRWGELMFKTNDFYEYWDGKIMRSSKSADLAVYSWVVNLRDVYGNFYSYKGHVTIIR
ncbi:MAG: PKD domain-containing protein [Bacteroidetes bacterium]|nr:PKD domain-containing protein [Bacteroidota bacterium]